MADFIDGTVTGAGAGYLEITEIGTGTVRRVEIREPSFRVLAQKRLDGARDQQTLGDVAIMSGDFNQVHDVWDKTLATMAVEPDVTDEEWTSMEADYMIAIGATYLRQKEMRRG